MKGVGAAAMSHCRTAAADSVGPLRADPEFVLRKVRTYSTASDRAWSADMAVDASARLAGRPSGLQIPDEPLQINGDLLENSAIQPAAIIRRATQEERLQLGDAIVQCISGSTGTSLARVAIALGFKCLVFSNASSGKSYRTCQSAL